MLYLSLSYRSVQSGFRLHSSEQMDKRTFEIIKAGNLCDLRLETNAAITVNIWMKNPRCKCNLSCFEGVVCRKRNCQNEYTALIWAVFVSHITACQGHISCPTGLTHKAPVVLRIPGFCGELKVGQCGWSIGGE